MPPKQSRSRRPRSDIAQVYHHPRGPGYAAIQGIVPLKSGLTPITLGPNITPQQAATAENIRWMQRLNFYNFTAAELNHLKVLAPLEDCKNHELSGPIHPVFAREKWNQENLPKHLARYPMGEQRAGYWDAYENDVVWGALTPSLVLATRYLDNAYLWPWWDALLSKDYTDVDLQDLKPGDRQTEDISGDINDTVLKRFSPRDPTIASLPETRAKMSEYLIELAENIEWLLQSGSADSQSGIPQQLGGILAGETIELRGVRNKAKVGISFEQLEPLLPGNINRMNVADQKLSITGVAHTVIHELCHALYRRIHPELEDVTDHMEPYFQDEVIQELGHSMEQAVLGGVVRTLELVEDLPEWPFAGIVAHDFNNAFMARTRTSASIQGPGTPEDIDTLPSEGQPVLTTLPQDFYIIRFFPISADWCTSMFATCRWDSIRQYGGQSGWMGPRGIGTEYQINNDGQVPNPKRSDPYKEFEGITFPMESETEKLRQLHVHRVMNARKTLQPPPSDSDQSTTTQKPSDQFEEATTDNPEAEEDESESGSDEDSTSSNSEPDDSIYRSGQCPRFREIHRYLLDNRRDLALHTMCFEMPEHTLRAYILRHGGLDITAYEWRSFLLRCEDRGRLFSFQHYGRRHEPCTYRGIVTLIRPGWPKGAVAPPPPPSTIPDETTVEEFVQITELAIRTTRKDRHPLFGEERFWDLDVENIRYFLNNIKKMMNQPELTTQEIDAIIYTLASRQRGEKGGDLYTWAPKGIFRRVPTSGPQLFKVMTGLPVKRRRDKRLIDWSKDVDSSDDDSESGLDPM